VRCERTEFVIRLGAGVKEGEQVVLEQIRGREADAAGVERFEHLVGIEFVGDGDDGEE
jgi:hypothetical protein